MADPEFFPAIAAAAFAIVYLLGFAGCSSFEAVESEPKTVTGPPLVIDPTPEPPPPPSTYPGRVQAETNLISYWRLSETAGTVAKDSAPTLPRDGEFKDTQDGVTLRRGVAGALAETASPAVDPLDRSIEFLQRAYVEVTYDLRRNPPQAFSLELWLNTAEGQQTPRYAASSCQVNAAGELTAGYAIEVAFNPLRVRARVGMKNAGGQSAEFNQELALVNPVGGKWWHVVMTYTGASRQLILSVNGVGQTVTAPAALNGFNYSAAISPTPLRIASGPAPGATTPGKFFNGFLDEVGLYNPPMSAAQVSQHFLAGTVKGS